MSFKRRLRNKTYIITNGLLRRINGLRKSSLRIAIVSSDEWKGKAYDDLLLQRELVKRGFQARIVAFEDSSVDYFNYDLVIIRSMWGYQNNPKAFSTWMANVRSSGIKVYNNLDIVRNNYDKAIQLKTLKSYPTIPTKVIPKGAFLKMKNYAGFKKTIGKINEETPLGFPFVIKPTISASGENTFLFKSEYDFTKLRSKLAILNKNRELMVQKYIPEIADGELAVIMIDGEISHVVRRFPGIFTGEKFRVRREPGEIDEKLKGLCQKVSKLKCFRDALYLRMDVVKKGNSYLIMEVEVFEPALYFFLLDKKERKKVFKRFIDGLLR